MRQILYFILISYSLSLWANTEELEAADQPESILTQELSTVEEGQKEFDHLVESTMNVMEPGTELNQSFEQ